jgi:hypothetical protein
MIAGSANAAQTAILKDIIKGGDLNRTGMVDTNMDDCTLKWSYQDGYEKGTDPVSMTYGVPRDTSGESWCLVVGPEWGTMQVALVGVVDVFNLLPESTIAGRDDILAATLRIHHRGPTGGEEIGIYRVTTPWLVQAAGSNETSVTAVHALPGGENRYWAADVGKTPGTDTEGNPTYDNFVGFSSQDYTTEDGQSFTIVDTTYGGVHDVDITEIVKDWYSEANHGVCLMFENDYWQYSDAPYFQDSEQNSSWDNLPDGSSYAIELIVTYMPEPTTIGLLAIGGVAALIRRKR